MDEKLIFMWSRDQCSAKRDKRLRFSLGLGFGIGLGLWYDSGYRIVANFHCDQLIAHNYALFYMHNSLFLFPPQGHILDYFLTVLPTLLTYHRSNELMKFHNDQSCIRKIMVAQIWLKM